MSEYSRWRPRHTQTHSLTRTTRRTLYRANRLLAGEAEERYITRLDKPVQRNILEIRSAIIYCRALFSSWRARRSANVVSDARFLYVAQSAAAGGVSMRTKKTQLRGQTAEVGGRKRVKNARGRRRRGRTGRTGAQ